jgi:peptidoglycan-associated lipoprotein
MKYFIILITVIFIFCGCTPKVVKLEQPGATGKEGPAFEKGEKEGGVTEEELARSRRERERLMLEEMKKSLLKDIHFDFDSYTIQADELPRLKEMGSWLKNDRDIRITIEGHCDERGSIEYNLVLGQKRAETVKDHLVKLGVDKKRIKTISYGKELLLDPGHTEEAWAKNRRAHFKVD